MTKMVDLPQDDITKRLNKRRVDESKISTDLKVYEVDPQTLVNHRRFDIMAKYIYCWFRENGIESDWGSRLYEDHLWVFNRYDEDDASGKKGIRSFISSFNSTLQSIKEHGFDEEVSLLPIGENKTPLDGAHRLTAALLYNKRVKVIQTQENGVNYNYEFFRKKGLLTRWSDAMAYQYCKVNQNTFILILFPDAVGKKNEVKRILEIYGDIYYEKNINLTQDGIINLRTYLFNDLNRNENDCDQLSVLVFETSEFNHVSKVSEQMKELYKAGNHIFYINQTHKVTVALAQMLFNENSIYFLNHTTLNFDGAFTNLLSEYKGYLANHNLNHERFCVVSDAVLAACGLGDSSKLEFIHFGYGDLEKGTGFGSLESYNNQLRDCRKTKDDIIFNPENHFYFDGIKFASLQAVKDMKKRKNGPKSKEEIRMINKYLGRRYKIDTELFNYTMKKKLKLLRLKIGVFNSKCRRLLRFLKARQKSGYTES